MTESMQEQFTEGIASATDLAAPSSAPMPAQLRAKSASGAMATSSRTFALNGGTLIVEAPDSLRIVTDEQLGIPLDETLELTARRMDNRDMEQADAVALLQRDPEAYLQGRQDKIAQPESGQIAIAGYAPTILIGPSSEKIQTLIDDRNAARKGKNFAEADRIRKELEDAGIVLEDKPGGKTEWRRK